MGGQKARKNACEVAAMRAACLRDSAAVVAFLACLDQRLADSPESGQAAEPAKKQAAGQAGGGDTPRQAAPSDQAAATADQADQVSASSRLAPGSNFPSLERVALEELALAEALKGFRAAAGGGYKGDSFETISAAGPNSAVIHYKPEAGKDRPVTKEEMYLLDTGRPS